MDPTASYILNYALPLQQLYITGKNANPTNWISSVMASNAVAAATYSPGTNTTQLMADMANYDFVVRRGADSQLGTLPNVSFSAVTNLAASTNALVRDAACCALAA